MVQTDLQFVVFVFQDVVPRTEYISPDEQFSTWAPGSSGKDCLFDLSHAPSFVVTKSVLEFLVNVWYCQITLAIWSTISLGSFLSELLLCQAFPS